MDPVTERRRHSAAHVLAMAVLRLFPDAKLGIGPVTNQGFYHDFHLPRRLEWEDIKQIEAEINLIIQDDLVFKRLAVPREQAFEILMTRGQIYKSELLQDIHDEDISFFRTGDEFIDLCRGPHVGSTNEVGAVKLLEISETHWKNDPERPELQRISGVVFATPHELTQFMQRRQEIQFRDFRKYAQELDLTYDIDDTTVYTTFGTTSLLQIQDRIVQELTKENYEQVLLPSVAELSSSEVLIDKLYLSRNRSYRSLPFRVFTINRNELSDPIQVSEKPLHSVTQIVSKSYTLTDSGAMETRKTLLMLLNMFNKLGLRARAEIHASDLELEILHHATELLSQQGISQTQIIDALTPKDSLIIHLIAQDSLKREWNLFTMRYNAHSLNYIATDGQFNESRSVTVQTVIDKVMAFYLEDQEGGLPYWAAPVQAIIVPISEQQEFYAEHIGKNLAEQGIRSEIDNRGETMQARIRDAEINRTPIIIVVGEKEEASRAVSVRLRNSQELGLISEQSLLETLESYITSFSQT